jgi:predicted nucleotidyltransferase
MNKSQHMHNLAEKEEVLESHVKRALVACRDAILAEHLTAGVVLYGSHARGQAGHESDMDLLILLNEDVTARKKRLIHDKIYEIGLREDLAISAIVRSYDAWNSPISQATPFYNAIQREGIKVA